MQLDNWIAWLVPLTALVIWIILNLLRAPNEEPAPQRRPQPRPNRPPSPEQRESEQHPITDLDRFLQEVQRRRESEESRELARTSSPSPQARSDPARRPEEVPAVLPVRRSRQRTSPPPLPRERAQQPGKPVVLQPVAEALPRVKPVAKAPRQETATLTAAPTVTAPAEPVMPSAPTGTDAHFSETPRTKRPTSSVASQVMALLGDRGSVQAAYALREILDQPVSKRPKRRWY